MATVSSREGIMYGFSLIGCLFVLAIIGYIASILSLMMFTEQRYFLMLLFIVVGALVVIAGLLGMTYKVISDAVQNGVTNAT